MSILGERTGSHNHKKHSDTWLELKKRQSPDFLRLKLCVGTELACAHFFFKNDVFKMSHFLGGVEVALGGQGTPLI